LYGSGDPTRLRFYLDGALRLAPPESRLASEVRYDLACRFAKAQDFKFSMRELSMFF
jgi:hypothetical protein